MPAHLDADQLNIEIALLREFSGFPLADFDVSNGCLWWSTHEKGVAGAERWFTVATGQLYHKLGNDYISTVGGELKTPNPDNWTILSCHIGGDRETRKVLWPPVPFGELVEKLKNPIFRMEYMLPKLARELKE